MVRRIITFVGRVGVFVVFGSCPRREEGVFDFPNGGFGADGEFKVFFLLWGAFRERNQMRYKEEKTYSDVIPIFIHHHHAEKHT